MHYIVTADTDKGKVKQTNQDSVVFKHAVYDRGEVLMAIICDGMGGLSKGELASASVVKAFARWFENELPYELDNPDMNVIGANWSLLLKELNGKILEYSKNHGVDSIGTTFTGILFINNDYVIAHVGDTRVYHIDRNLRQLTTDQTFIAREISRGTLTAEQAKTDKRRNLLLQCIGASKNVEPEVLTGTVESGVYMLCSDGFRHEISEKEIFDNLKPSKLKNQKIMHANAKHLIEEVKNRGEVDNISVVLIKVEGGDRP